MIRRLLRACVGAVLVGALTVPARATAKPPDLPMNETNTVTPRVVPEGELVVPPPMDVQPPQTAPTPVRAHPLLKDIKIEVSEGNTGSLIFGIGVNSNGGLIGSIVFNERNVDLTLSNVVQCVVEELLPPAVSLYEILPNAVPTPTVYQLHPTARRTLAGSLLFGLHPLMGLLPTDKVLDAPHDHPRRVAGEDVFGETLPKCYPTRVGIVYGFWSCDHPRLDLFKLMKALFANRPDTLLLEQNEGYLTGSLVASAAEIDAPLVPAAEALPMPREDKPHKKKHNNLKVERLPMPREEPSGSVTCPYLRQQMMDRHACQMADPEIGRDVLDNLERLKQADGLVELAEELARGGCVAEALACCAHAEALCPGSPCAHRAGGVMLDVCFGIGEPKAGTEEAAEEPCEKRGDKKSDIEKKLKQPVSVSLTKTPLHKVIDELRTLVGLNIFVDEPALAEKGIDLNQPMNVKLDDIAFKSALNLIFHAVHLTYVVQEDVLIITTEEAISRGKLQQRLYAVADLVQGKGLPKACQHAPRKANLSEEERLIELLTTTIAPRSWSEQGGAGTIEYYAMSQSLVVNQTPDVQDQIADLLAAVRRLIDAEKQKNEAAHSAKNADSSLKEPGVEQQVRGLMKACRLLMNEGLHHQAAELARQAFALDPESVMADPLVYKMHLLADTPAAQPSGGSEASEPPSCPYCPRAGEPIREIVPKKKTKSRPTTLLVPPMPPVDYEVVPALDRVLSEGAEEASEMEAPSGLAELIASLIRGCVSADGSLTLGACSHNGTFYRIGFHKGWLTLWTAPDARTVKP